MKQYLSQVRNGIINEIHEFAEDKCGVQLSVALERLFEFTKKNFKELVYQLQSETLRK